MFNCNEQISKRLNARDFLLSFSKANMGTNQEPNCTLYVRHLPSELNKSEKEDLLTHFGASRVKVMGNKGPMVCIFI